MEFHLTHNDKPYICKEIYDNDREQTVVQIYNGNNVFLCDIEDICIPDAEDEESCEDFKTIIIVFLESYYDDKPFIRKRL
jgi:hypothetical protein